MSREALFITDVNPNNTAGGGGCVCSPANAPDCQPPYAVFPNCATDSFHSPNVVICARCMEGALSKAKVIALENATVDGTAVEEPIESSVPQV